MADFSRATQYGSGEHPRRATGGPVVTRPARPDDAARLAVVNVQAWRSAYDGVVPAAYLAALDVETARDRWLERLTDAPADRLSVVAEVGGQVAAYAVGGGYRTQQDADPNETTTGWGELFAIYSHPVRQGRGAGTAVHDALVLALTAQGFRTAALWVLRDNVSAIAWYGRRGWRPDGAASTWLGAGQPLPEIRLVRPLPG